MPAHGFDEAHLGFVEFREVKPRNAHLIVSGDGGLAPGRTNHRANHSPSLGYKPTIRLRNLR